jgi:prephenate dehydrogenase
MKKIKIIGLGLMGGSIAKDLGEEAVAEMELVILATPLSTIIPLATEIAEQAKGPLIVMDIGSVKGEIARHFEKLSTDQVQFVATHPMAGSEKSGYENSRAGLFLDAPWVITPHSKNTPQALEVVEALIRRLGARPLRMDAETHDWRAALVSHLPYMASLSILKFVTKEEPESLEMAGPGFQSVTRLAHDNPALRYDIATQNAAMIKRAFNEWLDFLAKRNFL